MESSSDLLRAAGVVASEEGGWSGSILSRWWSLESEPPVALLSRLVCGARAGSVQWLRSSSRPDLKRRCQRVPCLRWRPYHTNSTSRIIPPRYRRQLFLRPHIVAVSGHGGAELLPRWGAYGPYGRDAFFPCWLRPRECFNSRCRISASLPWRHEMGACCSGRATAAFGRTDYVYPADHGYVSYLNPTRPNSAASSTRHKTSASNATRMARCPTDVDGRCRSRAAFRRPSGQMHFLIGRSLGVPENLWRAPLQRRSRSVCTTRRLHQLPFAEIRPTGVGWTGFIPTGCTGVVHAIR